MKKKDNKIVTVIIIVAVVIGLFYLGLALTK